MTLSPLVRILHVIPTLGRGGAERQLASLVSNATANEHIVCYLHDPSDFAEDLRRDGYTVIGLDISGRTKWLKAAAKLARLNKIYNPDIVQTWLLDASVSARISQLLGPRVPLITALQNPDYNPETIRAANWPRTKTLALGWLDQFTARWTATRFVACSHFVKTSAQEHLGIAESSIEVIYNSVDPQTLRCQPGEPRRLKDSLAIPPEGFVFVNVGRLDPQKGQSCLLHAFQKVVSSAPNAFLAIVGNGPLFDYLNMLALDLGIAERVRFLGRRTDVGACLEMADAFVFPSLFEGLGLALIEAMFKSLPCICSRINPLLEILADQDSGLFVEPRSVDELAAAMLELYSDPVRRTSFGTKAKEIAASRFHQSVTIPQWEDIYSRTVAGAS
jgi:glycosyltransferase involved in cell wall biosynthesis